MLRIAVTGGIACGKSTVGSILSAHGVTVGDTDDMAHHLLLQDRTIQRKITEEFGTTVLDREGRIDRATLGSIVFEQEDARDRLNRIVHPAVKAMCDRWLAEIGSRPGMAAVIIPLLYEANMASGWRAVVCVACARTTQMQRLRDRGLSARQAEKRIAAQMALRGKMRRADYVIYNDGGRRILEKQTEMVMDSIRERNAR